MVIVAFEDPIVTARAHVLRDLEATGVANPETVSLLEDAVSQRGWWLEQWPGGHSFVTGLCVLSARTAPTRCTSTPTSAAPTRPGCANRPA
jgi:hypothetical protein